MFGLPPGWSFRGGGRFGEGSMQLMGYGDFGRGIMGIDPYDPGRLGRAMVNQQFYSQHYTSRLDYCCKGCVSSKSCNSGECCMLDQAVRQAQKDYRDLNNGLLVLGGFGAAISLIFLLSGVGTPIGIGTALFFAMLSLLLYGIGVNNEFQDIRSSVSGGCFSCVQNCLKGLGIGFWDEILAMLYYDALGFIPNPFKKFPKELWSIIFGTESSIGGYTGPTGPWDDWLEPMHPPYAL
jgi:hypothetical protein